MRILAPVGRYESDKAADAHCFPVSAHSGAQAVPCGASYL